MYLDQISNQIYYIYFTYSFLLLFCVNSNKGRVK